ncbi:asparagine synthase (glutamine-hydrolyzing) [Massilia sp. S19_KUP03_FR1]|uniref:asparagine synthase (glutamine-hydrolyzing) n=1 Tax=Massilia sp. S19_KUP03_FR1 TaxID=3025503 RepID=UPI002FCD704B
MCGFTGYLGMTSFGIQAEQKILLKRMTDTLAHRGPDDAGYWCDSERGIALGHRRLSILDLSDAGHQPMRSPAGRYVIVFNGEIYNHMLMREELDKGPAAPAWRGHSDTETLLAGFDVWGVEGTVKRALGMFAFAVWDRQTHMLTLGRDRVGEKPLYYGWQGRGSQAVFLFGSELKALRTHPSFDNIIDRGSLCLQLRHSYVPAPYSIYRGIAKLAPGCLLTVSARQPETRSWTYWSGLEQAVTGVMRPFVGTEQQAVDQLDGLLQDAVRAQMIADVPLGAFLSGGVDSSTIVALMQAQSPRPIKTFSIGFHEVGFNEAEYAKAVAVHLGTEHTELYVNARQAQAVIPQLQSMYDEPFSDSSQIPTFLVSQLARQHVTVALSGDAGDELFCGYSRYQFAAKLWRTINRGPVSLRRLAAKGITSISVEAWNKTAAKMAHFLPASLKFANTGDKLHKGAQVLASATLDAVYLGLVSHWDDPASLVIGGSEPPTLLRGNAPRLSGLDGIQRMMALDLVTYLPDDILVKVDRAAMNVSLETRIPFLDHRVVDFAWSLPQSLKLRDGTSKWALRQVLYRYVPKAMIERPKMGFGVPIGSWLRGPLREWAESLLNESRLKQEGFFDAVQLRKKWHEHLSGQRNWQFHLWDVLMFQSWIEQQVADPTGASRVSFSSLRHSNSLCAPEGTVRAE